MSQSVPKYRLGNSITNKILCGVYAVLSRDVVGVSEAFLIGWYFLFCFQLINMQLVDTYMHVNFHFRVFHNL